MIRGYDADQVRAAEQPLLAAGEPLMLRAARALADRTAALLSELTAHHLGDHRILVLAGPGSNGGDGLYAAAMLRRERISADALATGASLHDEGAQALRDAGGAIHRLADLTAGQIDELLTSTTVVLDAILGIGGRPEIPAPIAPLLDAVREHDLPVIAVDVPSFVDATTGRAAPGALAARETVTVGAVKTGLLLPGAAELAGNLHLVDIGLEPHLPTAPAVQRLETVDLAAHLPRPTAASTKYTQGVVALAAGSEQYPGAALLAASGAARTGAGMVRVLAPRRVVDLVLGARPEIIGHLVEPGADGRTLDLSADAIGRTDALVIGPGLPPEDPRALAGVRLLTSSASMPGVIDAGALSVLDSATRLHPDMVLTPHRGEAERLARRLHLDARLPAAELARALAAATGATILLKGAITLIAPGDGGPLLSQADGTPRLATAGTGDVLAGILGALLAAGIPGPQAAATAAALHGRAGRLASHDGRLPLVALDVADHLPAAAGTILNIPGAP
ncbi:NAD(P)H-hydrate dehydratase [Brachybacterium sp. Marseille-Q7125]|uniref:NAD(P)H-hydrate dehydratase n=1 Tax=Brachybacterium sp. Marseille-Q7125 TaxID=2932815 RepID=UPI001FF41356|nr:NAD(P)H-hydrate dehydratase [Brachybacterium sp. Marseille-Q7125]